ncbi:MAG: hypothetical protein H6Q00_135 [Holophagaceae bacterium]|nr:hypothetical protein [Holophagaceae bacterium]
MELNGYRDCLCRLQARPLGEGIFSIAGCAMDVYAYRKQGLFLSKCLVVMGALRPDLRAPALEGTRLAGAGATTWAREIARGTQIKTSLWANKNNLASVQLGDACMRCQVRRERYITMTSLTIW